MIFRIGLFIRGAIRVAFAAYLKSSEVVVFLSFDNLDSEKFLSRTLYDIGIFFKALANACRTCTDDP